MLDVKDRRHPAFGGEGNPLVRTNRPIAVTTEIDLDPLRGESTRGKITDSEEEGPN